MDSVIIEIIKSFIGLFVVAITMLIAQFFLLPIIQKRIKIQEELWVHKKNIYLKSVELIDKRFDSMSYSGSKLLTEPLSTIEQNAICRELLIMCDNEEIIIQFQNLMNESTESEGNCSPESRGAYIGLLRNDLGKSKLSITDDKIPYFRRFKQK